MLVAAITFFMVVICIGAFQAIMGIMTDVQYGKTRTVQLDAVVGHGDSPASPTHFIAQNLNGQIFVVEIPAGNPSKTMVILGPQPFGRDAYKLIPFITVTDVNGDGKPDLQLKIDDATVTFLNDGTKFTTTSGVDAPAKPQATAGASTETFLKADKLGVDTENVEGASTLSAEQIDKVLQAWGSPAVGTGKDFIDGATKYRIRAEFALGFFVHESSAGTAGVARTTKSIGNIRCSAGYVCYEGFRSYDSWSAGIYDWYLLIRTLYVDGWGKRTLAAILPTYAPSSDGNRPADYAEHVRRLISAWSSGDYAYKG